MAAAKQHVGYTAEGPEHCSRVVQVVLRCLALQRGARVLDVGCGVGGSTYHIAETYGVHVHGLDLSVNCILLALERTAERPGADVTFEVADCTVRGDGSAGGCAHGGARGACMHA